LECWQGISAIDIGVNKSTYAYCEQPMTASENNGQHIGSTRLGVEHSECCGQSRPSHVHPSESMIEQLAELREYVLLYVEARKDKARAVVRRLVVVSVILIGVGIAWVTTLVAGAVLLVHGLAAATGSAIGNRHWAGQIVVGGSVVVGTLLVIILLAGLSNRAARQRTIEKYERRHRIQRARFGANARQRSAPPAPGV
jgi:hypothetical protein